MNEWSLITISYRSTEPPQISSFSNLPFELRELFFKELLSKHTLRFQLKKRRRSGRTRFVVMLSRGKIVDKRAVYRGTIDPADFSLLRTCRQTFLESNRLIYSTNTFYFDKPRIFHLFLTQRSSTQLQALTRIELDVESWYGSRHHSGWIHFLNPKMISQLKALRHLHLGLCLWTIYSLARNIPRDDHKALWGALQSFRHIPLKKIIVDTNGYEEQTRKVTDPGIKNILKDIEYIERTLMEPLE